VVSHERLGFMELQYYISASRCMTYSMLAVQGNETNKSYRSTGTERGAKNDKSGLLR
jgi:hypothetical protein